MEAEKKENSLGWSAAIGLTVILAGIACFMIVKRTEFFPELYQRSKSSEHSIESDSVSGEQPQGHH